MLDNSIKLSLDINKDIGYLYNEDLQNKPGLVYTREEGEEYDLWVGYRYRLWGAECQSWIYNDEEGEVIFELTPLFSGPFALGDKMQNKTQLTKYEKWLKSYQPILIRIIAKHIVHQLLVQVTGILDVINANVKKC